jgi:cyclophilin family peptidyl-prolyl cis-trans isomerase
MLNKILLILIIIILIILFLNFKNRKNKDTKENNHKIQKKDNLNKIQNTKKQLKSCIKRNKHIKKKKVRIHDNNEIINEINNKEVKKETFVYLTVEINRQEVGKIIIRLFDDIVPKTCNNFRQLCRTKKYVNSPFHRIIKDFMIQGGDFTSYNGTGGYSIYGNKFEDENFILKHDKPYLLSMANSGPNTNGSQFFITTTETPHLDGKHVVFGEVVKGFELIYQLNNVDTDHKDMPHDRIIISDSGCE